MPPGPKVAPIELSEVETHELHVLRLGPDETVAARARVILACAAGLSDTAVAQQESVSIRMVYTWRARFRAQRLEGMGDRPRAGRPVKAVVLTDDERVELLRYTRRGTTNLWLAQRARMVLACADGQSNTDVAALVGVDEGTVRRWRNRFVRDRVAGLSDLERPGAPRSIHDDDVEALVVKTLETMPKGATHWSTRSMAQNVGLSASSVGRIWRALGLKPHRTETFQLSTDPHFVEKVRDVVGLYMSPPDNALVLCVDEKSQIQALNRTQPMLPLRPGQVERRTPEYKRNGTTSLFAALDVATGSVIGKCYRRHRATEFRRFLIEIRSKVPEDVEVHIIVDNYATHSAPTVKQWLAKNTRFHLHFIPTHSSWLNEVEGWFGILTAKALQRASHTSIEELEAAIYAFIDAWQENPTPFKWTKTADQVLENVARYCYRTLTGHRNPEGTSGDNS